MRYWNLILVVMLAAFLSGCSDSVTRENFDRVEIGMTVPEVEEILGPAHQSYQGILTWRSGEKRFITIVLDDRKLVAEKDVEGL